MQHLHRTPPLFPLGLLFCPLWLLPVSPARFPDLKPRIWSSRLTPFKMYGPDEAFLVPQGLGISLLSNSHHVNKAVLSLPRGRKKSEVPALG